MTTLQDLISAGNQSRQSVMNATAAVVTATFNGQECTILVFMFGIAVQELSPPEVS